MLPIGTNACGVHVGYDAENPYRIYCEVADGYRLIFDLETGKYIGRYNPNLNEVI